MTPMRLLCLTAAAAALSGCASSSTTDRAAPAAADRVAPGTSFASGPGTQAEVQWWRLYGDSQLNELLAAALANAALANRGSEPEVVSLSADLVKAYGEFWGLAVERETAYAKARECVRAIRLVRSDQTMVAEARARRRLKALDDGLDRSRARIVALVGSDPGQGLALRTPDAARAPLALPANLADEVTRRRPELQSAKARLIAAQRRLSAKKPVERPGPPPILGLRSRGLNFIVRSGGDIGQAALGLGAPLLGGAGIGDTEEEERAAASAAYDRALKAALKAVEEASACEERLDRRLQEAQAILARREADYLAERRDLQKGGGSRRRLAAAERAVTACTNRVAILRAKGLIADAALVRALGGAFARSAS